MAGRKVFTSGEILTAADVNSFLMNQVVAVFADDDARATAIPSPSEGMVTYLKADDEVTVFDGSAFKAVGPGKILQVVQAVKTNASSGSIAGESTADTGLTLNITPDSISNKVLLTVSLSASLDNGRYSVLLRRNGSPTSFRGDSVGSRGRRSIGKINGQITGETATFSFLDSPASTSTQTYDVSLFNNSSTGANFFVNRSPTDTNSNSFTRYASSIIAMEVAG